MIMTDHPGWLHTGDTAHRALALGETATLITASRSDDGSVVVDSGGSDIRIDTIDPAGLSGPDDLVRPLKDAGVIVRVRNPSLWDALSAAIMRQVIQAGHARTRYIRFCTAYGEPVTRDGVSAWLFPDPHRILALTDEQFQDVGAAFPAPALRDAARCFLAQGEHWQTLPVTEQATALQIIPRVGSWTARTTVADFTGDFSFYDYSDIAVQPAARRLTGPKVPPRTRPLGKRWREISSPRGHF
jgi:DNA-3-methyladenine glycosylase II